MIERVRAELSAAEEFQGDVADNVMLVVRAVVYFLAVRLRAPKPYQREDGKGAGAVEGDLQDDLFEWLQSGALTHGMKVFEPQRVGGGRADLAVVFSAQQVVNEVKREQRDSSREAMQMTYAEQAGSYDATDYPFGLVPVLDISSEPASTPRLGECVWVHRHEDTGGGTLARLRPGAGANVVAVRAYETCPGRIEARVHPASWVWWCVEERSGQASRASATSRPSSLRRDRSERRPMRTARA